MDGLNLETIAEIRIQLNQNGGIQISGHIGDKALALRLLDHARDAIKNQLPETGSPVIVPNYDVDVPDPKFVTKPYGDFDPRDLGDLAKCRR